MDASTRMVSLAPLLIGGLIGFAALARWPGRGVEVGLGILIASALLASRF